MTEEEKELLEDCFYTKKCEANSPLVYFGNSELIVGDGQWELDYPDEKVYSKFQEKFDEILNGYRNYVESPLKDSTFPTREQALLFSLSDFEYNRIVELLHVILYHITNIRNGHDGDDIIGLKISNSYVDPKYNINVVELSIKSIEEYIYSHSLEDRYICLEDNIIFIHAEKEGVANEDTLRDFANFVKQNAVDVYNEMLTSGYFLSIKDTISYIIMPDVFKEFIKVDDIDITSKAASDWANSIELGSIPLVSKELYNS